MYRIEENKTKFVVGIDFGHGETAAALYDIEKGETKRLDILPGKSVVKSAVAILEQEGEPSTVIGDGAIGKMGDAKRFQISFKKRPSIMSQDEKSLMISFMEGVYTCIRNQNNVLNDQNHVVYIARPSHYSWDSEENKYLAMAEQAGIPIAGVHKESRAAYYMARNNANSNIDQRVKDGVLIVDYGSSTIDFTYWNKNLVETIDDGCDYGANAVETTLMQDFLKTSNNEDVKGFYRLYGQDLNSNPYNRMLFEFRKAKEEYYSIGTANKLTCKLDLSDCTLGEDVTLGEDGISYTYRKTKEEINKLLSQYIDNVTEKVNEFKNNFLKDKKVAFVFITGGASRMDFVKDIFSKCFNIDKQQVERDNEPSEIVAKGIAKLSYIDYVTEERARELQEIVLGIVRNFKWNKEIRNAIYPIVKEEIEDKAYLIMKKWRDGKIVEGNIHNINALRRVFKSDFRDYSSHNFAESSNDLINKKIIDNVVGKIKETFKDYEYKEDSESHNINVNISVKLLENQGVQKLIGKFTGEGDDHIIYDVVKENFGFMVGWNLGKNRDDDARTRHFNEYPRSIFPDDEWKEFLDRGLSIEGVDKLKTSVTELVIRLMNNYINYARMAAFVN